MIPRAEYICQLDKTFKIVRSKLLNRFNDIEAIIFKSSHKQFVTNTGETWAFKFEGQRMVPFKLSYKTRQKFLRSVCLDFPDVFTGHSDTNEACQFVCYIIMFIYKCKKIIPMVTHDVVGF